MIFFGILLKILKESLKENLEISGKISQEFCKRIPRKISVVIPGEISQQPEELLWVDFT